MDSAPAMTSATTDDEPCVVAEWLHTLELAHYTQAFIDNGYDELDTCQQIGEPDLDAIGVTRPRDRREILDAVELLKTHGAQHVYYVLEQRSREYEHFISNDDNVSGGGGDCATDEYAEGRKAFVSFPKLHLCAIVREKLIKYGIKLTQAPFINQVSKNSVIHRKVSVGLVALCGASERCFFNIYPKPGG